MIQCLFNSILMSKIRTAFPYLLILSAIILCFSHCKKTEDETPTPNPIPLPKVFNLIPSDVGNNGNGSDLQVDFIKLSDESNVKEYRIFVVKKIESAGFNLEKAEAVSLGNFTTVNKSGSNISIILAADAKTTTGELIGNDEPYRVFVLAVALDPTTNSSTLSNRSAEISLDAGDKVKVTYIANDGVMIEFEDQKVVIDAINRTSNLTGWVSPSSAALRAVENGDPPYDNIDVIMITHGHGDHYATSAVRNYLSNNPQTKLIAPSSIRNTFGASSSQLVHISLDKFERTNQTLNGINIDILQVEHFDQFGNNFSGLESYAYVVQIKDKKFFHAGDIDYVDSKLDLFNLLPDNITAAFIPTFGNLVNAENRDALINHINPKHVVGLHFQTASLSTTLGQIHSIYPGAITFTTPFQIAKF